MVSIQKCTRGLRPLQYQLRKCRNFFDSHAQELDLYWQDLYRAERTDCDKRQKRASRQYAKRRRNRIIIGPDDTGLVEEACQLIRTTWESFFTFFDLTFSKACKRRALLSRSAFEVGRCVVLTSGECDESQWHRQYEGRLGDGMTEWVAIGEAVQLMALHMEWLKFGANAAILHCISAGAIGPATALLEAVVSELAEVQFWFQLETILHLTRRVGGSGDGLLAHLKETGKDGGICVDKVAAMLSTNRDMFSAEAILDLCTVAPAAEVLQHAFERSTWPGTGQVAEVANIANSQHCRRSSKGVSKALNLYLRFRSGRQLREHHNYRDQDMESSFLVIFRSSKLVMMLVDSILPHLPSLALSLSTQFVAKNAVDLPVVLWQDTIETRAMAVSTEHLEYNPVLGVWTCAATAETSENELENTLTDHDLCPDLTDTSMVESDDEEFALVPNRNRKPVRRPRPKRDLYESEDEIAIVGKPRKRVKAAFSLDSDDLDDILLV